MLAVQDDSLVPFAEHSELEQVLLYIWNSHADSLVRASTPAECGGARPESGLQGQRDSIPELIFILPVDCI